MKEAYITFARNLREADDALFILKSIRDTKTSRQCLILLDSENCEDESWDELAISFDGVINLKSNGFYDSRCHAFLHCMTLVHFDRICLVDPSAVVFRNMDDIFGTDASKFVFGNGITMLTPNIGTHQNLLNNLDGLEKQKTIDELKRVMEQDFQVLKLDNKFHLDFDKEKLISTKLVDKVERLSTSGKTNVDSVANKISNLTSRIDDNEDSGNKHNLDKNTLVVEDSKLWKHIQLHPTTKPYVPLGEIKTIFLTGGTGFLGPYMIQQLTKMPQIEKIFCLVRALPKSTESTLARLHSRLKFLDLFDITDLSKLHVVDGDVSLDNFGLELPMYEFLSREVDAIVHFAVRSDHVRSYKNLSMLQSINVTGTQRVIQFAAEHKVKWINNASSMVCFLQNMSKIKHLELESWPELRDFDLKISFGYGISKLIGDILIRQAVEIGIPCKSFRFPIVSGATVTGKQDLDGTSNHLMKRVIHLVSTGIVPDKTIPLVQIPVDVCAKICISIFFNEDAPLSMYNLLNPHLQREIALLELVPELGKQLVIIQLYGFALKEVALNETERFVAYWIQLCKNNGLDLQPFKEILLEFVTDPGKIFENEGILEYLKSQIFHGDIVHYGKFVEYLKTCEMSMLHPYAELYDSGGSYYHMTQRSDELIEEFVGKVVKRGYVTKYFPNWKEVTPTGLECVRNDLNYTVKNAKDLFQTGR